MILKTGFERNFSAYAVISVECISQSSFKREIMGKQWDRWYMFDVVCKHSFMHIWTGSHAARISTMMCRKIQPGYDYFVVRSYWCIFWYVEMTSVMVQIILMTICKAQVPHTVFYTCNTDYILMPGMSEERMYSKVAKKSFSCLAPMDSMKVIPVSS